MPECDPGIVAIVDDEESLIRIYELLFQRHNIPVSFIAVDGREAVEKFKKCSVRPGIVIIDYRLPSASGLDVMRSMLEIEPGTKAVLISGDESARQEAIDSGASAFLKKPVGIKEITDTVVSLMGDGIKR